jgi:CheY-like chemotaxis protein
MSPIDGCVRVLLIEDNAADAEILAEVLTDGMDRRFEVEWVERVVSAEERLARRPSIDVALVDLKLPDADGLDALDRLRQVAPHLPLLVMTGFDDETLAAEAKRRGASGYLIKGRTDGAQLCAALLEAVAAALPSAVAAGGR